MRCGPWAFACMYIYILIIIYVSICFSLCISANTSIAKAKWWDPELSLGFEVSLSLMWGHRSKNMGSGLVTASRNPEKKTHATAENKKKCLYEALWWGLSIHQHLNLCSNRWSKKDLMMIWWWKIVEPWLEDCQASYVWVVWVPRLGYPIWMRIISKDNHPQYQTQMITMHF